VFERELPDADVVISQPFWPAYLTADRIAQAKRLKLAITAGIGSDHVDLQAAIDRGITVAEVTYKQFDQRRRVAACPHLSREKPLSKSDLRPRRFSPFPAIGAIFVTGS
jgi:hypothetical protein